jgi:hypothetical protein
MRDSFFAHGPVALTTRTWPAFAPFLLLKPNNSASSASGIH